MIPKKHPAWFFGGMCTGDGEHLRGRRVSWSMPMTMGNRLSAGQGGIGWRSNPVIKDGFRLEELSDRIPKGDQPPLLSLLTQVMGASHSC